MKRETFNQILDSCVEQEQDYIREHNEIKAILLPLVGKVANGQTLNKKRLGNFKLDLRYGMIHIEGKYSHLIGYQGSGYKTSENLIAVSETDYSRGFEYFDACHGSAALNRIEQVKQTDKDKAFELFNKIDEHFTALKQLFGNVEMQNLGSYNFPCYYELLKSIHSDDKYLKLSDFYFIREEKEREL